MSNNRLCSVLAGIVVFAIWIAWFLGTNEPVTKVSPGELYRQASSHVGVEEFYRGFRR
jgi:hypothetical protein